MSTAPPVTKPLKVGWDKKRTAEAKSKIPIRILGRGDTWLMDIKVHICSDNTKKNIPKNSSNGSRTDSIMIPSQFQNSSQNSPNSYAQILTCTCHQCQQGGQLGSIMALREGLQHIGQDHCCHGPWGHRAMTWSAKTGIDQGWQDGTVRS